MCEKYITKKTDEIEESSWEYYGNAPAQYLLHF